ncbi:MAG: protein kinase, partial [Gemmataceae bacterium]|nr:protein kinase [Gemmataceae bacterium]
MNKIKGLSQSNKDTDDELLASLLEDLLNQSRKGINNLEQVCLTHPELAQELRELWAASQFADAFGRSDLDQPQKPLKESPIPATSFPKYFGEFELLEELGRGGMGVVYKAWQKNLGRMVALKMVLRGGHARPEEMARFQAEAKAIALLEHPNIVPVHEAGIFEEQPYFSMRFVEGQTLATILAQGPIKPRDAASLIAKITRAVHHAHERGV